MKTVITQEIDGYTIVTGVGDPVIDAVATRLKVDKLMNNDPDMLEFHKKTQAANLKLKEFYRANKKRSRAARAQTLWEQFQNTILEIQADRKKLNEKCTELYKKNIEYFQPKPGEFIVTDEIWQKYLALLQERKNQQVCFHGGHGLIPDLRGQRYWIKKDGKWEHGVIEKLGEEFPCGYKTAETMPDETKHEIIEQLHTERIRGLSDDEKQKELEKEKNIALDRAAFMKSRLEVEGDDQALEKSREWHKAETERLELRYK